MASLDPKTVAALRQERDVMAALERRYSLREGFMAELKGDPNDWSYLVRLQVFLEALLTDAVVAKSGRPKLRDYAQGMNIGGNRGLVALATALDVLAVEQGRFITKLADTRNSFAHRIANIDRRLEDYVDALPHEQRTALWKGVLFYQEGKPWAEPRAGEFTLGGLIRSLFWFGGLQVATQLHGTISAREKQALSREISSAATALVPVVADFGVVWDVRI